MALPINSRRDKLRAAAMLVSINILNVITLFGLTDLTTEEFAGVTALIDSLIIGYFYATG